jgi:hypothetical protein
MGCLRTGETVFPLRNIYISNNTRHPTIHRVSTVRACQAVHRCSIVHNSQQHNLDLRSSRLSETHPTFSYVRSCQQNQEFARCSGKVWVAFVLFVFSVCFCTVFYFILDFLCCLPVTLTETSIRQVLSTWSIILRLLISEHHEQTICMNNALLYKPQEELSYIVLYPLMQLLSYLVLYSLS